MNTVALIGRLGRDPESKFTTSGKQVVNFSIAVDTGFGENKATSWFNVVAWEKQAELIEKYAGKGAQVGIEGRLQARSYTAKDGSNRTVVEIVAKNITLLGSRDKAAAEVSAETPEPDDSDIPF